MRSFVGSFLAVIWAAIVAFLIALLPQGVWAALITANLKTSPGTPWAVVVMALFLSLMCLYLGGKFWPSRTSEARSGYLRAKAVPGPIFGWAVVACGLAITALAGFWMVLAQLVRMPGSVLPPMQNVPRLMVILAVGMGALISPICEQAGFWGYGQGILQRKLSGVTAIVFSALTFAVLPHPPLHAPYLPKLVFFFLIGLTFAVTAHLTKSILPGLLVHVLGLLGFFTLVWPHDPSRQLLSQGGADTSFYIHAALAVLFAALAVLAFIRLAKVSEPVASV